MIRIANAAAASAILAAMTLLISCVSADQNSATDRVPAPSAAPGVIALASRSAEAVSKEQVYMFRGGFNGVFSTGINTMAAKLGKRGITAHSENWSAFNSSLKAIKKAYADNRTVAVVLVGHSLGGPTAMSLANQLTAVGIPVDLVILFDPIGPSPVPKGVRKLINYQASVRKDYRGDYKPGPGFNGEIVNMNIRTLPELSQSSHWNIVNQPALQERAVQEIVRVVRGRRRV